MKSKAIQAFPLRGIEVKRMGQIALSELKHEPGLIEKVERSLEDPALAPSISFVDVMYFVTQTKSMRLVKDKSPYFAFNKYSIIEGLKDWLNRVKILKEYEIEIYLPITEVHCPKINGCEASFTQKTQSEKGFYLEVKVLGFGGGSGKSRSIGRWDTIVAEEGCRYFRMPARYKIQECQGGNKEFFVRGDVATLGNGFQVIPIPKDEDQCEKRIEEVEKLGWKPKRFDLSQVPETSSTGLTVAKGVKVECDWGFEFLPLKLAVKGTVKVLKELKYEYSLSGLHEYNGYTPSDTFSYCWNWK